MNAGRRCMDRPAAAATTITRVRLIQYPQQRSIIDPVTPDTPPSSYNAEPFSPRSAFSHFPDFFHRLAANREIPATKNTAILAQGRCYVVDEDTVNLRKVTDRSRRVLS